MKKFLLTLLCAAGLATATNAAVSELYTVQFGPSYDDPDIGSYTASWTATRDGKEWNLVNFNNNSYKNEWTFVKCGRKDYASVGTISSADALPDKISSVVVTIGAVTDTYVKSISLSVADNSEFKNAVVIEAAKADIKAGDLTFNVATPAANKYYKLTFDCAAAKKNGVVQVNKVVFSGEAGESPEYKVATPELTMEKGEWGYQLVMTCATEGASIHYTLDGTAPTAASELYTEPVFIMGESTVKAIALKGEDTSAVITKTFNAPAILDGFGAMLDFPTGTKVEINGAMTAVWQGGSNLYMKDSFGAYMLFYGTNATTFANGDVVNHAEGTYKPYNGLPEVQNYTLGEKSAGTAVAPAEATLDMIAGNMLNHYVKIENVTIAADATDTKGKTYTMTDADEQTALLFNQLGYDMSTLEAGKAYTVTGFVGCFGTGENAKYQLFPVDIVEYTAVDPSVVAAPVIKAVRGDYGYMVEMSCASEGSKIYYTTDETEPTSASEEYTAPLECWEATTYKAIAYVGDKASAVAEFYFNPPYILDSFNGLTDMVAGGEEYNVEFETQMQAIYQSGDYTFVRAPFSRTNMLFYGNAPALVNGDTFFTASGVLKANENGMPCVADVTYGDITEGGTPYEPMEATVAEIVSYMPYEYYVLNGVTVAAGEGEGVFTVTGKSEEGEDATATMKNLLNVTLAAGKYTSITGFVVVAGEDVYFLPVEAVAEGGSEEPTYGTALFDFTDPEVFNAYGITTPADVSTGTNLCGKGESKSITVEKITLTVTVADDATESQLPRVWKSTDGSYALRSYAKTTIAFVPENYKVTIKEIKFESKGKWDANNTYDPNTFDADTKTWAPAAAAEVVAFAAGDGTFTMTNGGRTDIGKVTVKYEVGAAVDEIGISSDDSNAEAVYYNLQGVRVANPSNGIFIKVKGSKSEKVLVK